MHAPSFARLLGATLASAALAFACSATAPDAPGSSTDPVVAGPGGSNNGGGSSDPSPGGEPCGDTTCGEGLLCCNASCGICTPPDGACIQVICGPTGEDASTPDANVPDAKAPDANVPDANPGGEPCGDTTCGDGLVCCNASCGICTPPDGACIQVLCGRAD